MSNYTKGTWMYIGGQLIAHKQDRCPIIVAEARFSARQLHIYIDNDDDALLIKAAPKLLEACKYCHILLSENIGQETHTLAQLEAAIAEAEGAGQ